MLKYTCDRLIYVRYSISAFQRTSVRSRIIQEWLICAFSNVASGLICSIVILHVLASVRFLMGDLQLMCAVVYLTGA
jgi:hypothetical protein